MTSENECRILEKPGILERSPGETAGIRLAEDAGNHQKEPHLGSFRCRQYFRGFIAKLQQDLLEQGEVEGGIVAVDTFDFDIIDKIYTPYDSMTMLVSLLPDGSMKKVDVWRLEYSLKSSCKGWIVIEIEDGKKVKKQH